MECLDWETAAFGVIGGRHHDMLDYRIGGVLDSRHPGGTYCPSHAFCKEYNNIIHMNMNLVIQTSLSIQVFIPKDKYIFP